jgi:acetyl esterase/lipase
MSPKSRHLALSNTLHPPTLSYLQSANAPTRFLSTLPFSTSLYQAIRDRGYFSSICDSLTYAFGPILLVLGGGIDGLKLLLNYLDLASKKEVVRYGDHPRQFVEYHKNAAETSKSPKLIIFFHGGAWGSGHSSMYRGIARTFLKEGFSVGLINYRIWPYGDVAAQAEDVALACEALQKHTAGEAFKSVTLIGHSSGAHISLISRFSHPTDFVTHAICLSGVYDLAEHSDYEALRGLEELSTLKSAGGYTRDSMAAFSVSRCVETLPSAFPKVLLYHGMTDDTVPFVQTVVAGRLLREHGLPVYTLHDNGDHMSPILSLFFDNRKETDCLQQCLSFIEDCGEWLGEAGSESGDGCRVVVRSKL